MRGRYLLPLVFLFACPKAETPAATGGQDEVFWSWFKANEVRLADEVNGDPVKVMNEIGKPMETARPGVIAEIAIDSAPGALQTLVISADGDLQRFDDVKALAQGAPALTRWKVVAFRPRGRAQEKMEMDGQTYAVTDFFFVDTGHANGKVGVDIMIRGLDDTNRKGMSKAAFLFLDGIVGELDTETKIGAIEFKPLEEGSNAKPLTELPAVVDSLVAPR